MFDLNEIMNFNESVTNFIVSPSTWTWVSITTGSFVGLTLAYFFDRVDLEKNDKIKRFSLGIAIGSIWPISLLIFATVGSIYIFVQLIVFFKYVDKNKKRIGKKAKRIFKNIAQNKIK